MAQMQKSSDCRNALLRPVTGWTPLGSDASTGPVTGLFVVIVEQSDGVWYQATDELSEAQAKAAAEYLTYPGSYHPNAVGVIPERQ